MSMTTPKVSAIFQPVIHRSTKWRDRTWFRKWQSFSSATSTSAVQSKSRRYRRTFSTTLPILSQQHAHEQQQLLQSTNTQTMKKPFDRVLIANRGEIAERIIRTCHALNIETVAIYSTADAQGRFVKQATQAICVGPAAAAESYLCVPRVLEAIQQSNAHAVHPGYGFLSENAAFAQLVTDTVGVTWLGPPAHAVRSMGDKLMSKVMAEQAQVTTVPGHPDPVATLEEALEICNHSIKYPVLVKALAGGGGKGMRVCYNDQEVKDAWGIAQSEALKFFSDNRLLIEKFIEKPHHIEFQVLCDREAKSVIVFPERECSIQRRNQKVIEESPSVLLQPETRVKMAEEVVRLCKAVGYESAGTVEFLVDEEQNHYFLECNSRLQVEHSISEAICNVDLVKGQLYVGAGMGIPPEFQMIPGQPVLPYRGHAVEARVYAEDPLRNYLPSTGPLRLYLEPNEIMAMNTLDRYIRMDSGVCAGHIVSPHYDPMLSKVISYAPTRLEAIQWLSQALDHYVIDGVSHNAKLVQAVLRHEAFQKGDTSTNFLPIHFPHFSGSPLTEEEEVEFVAAATYIATTYRSLRQQPPLAGGDATSSGALSSVICKLGGQFSNAYRVQLNEGSAFVTPLLEDKDATGEESLTLNCASSSSSSSFATITVRLDPRSPLTWDDSFHRATLSVNGRIRTVQVLMEHDTGEIPMVMYGADRLVLIQSEREYALAQYMHPPELVDTKNLVQSPMPGTLIHLSVQVGDTVVEGQELCIVEAMKMQNIIRSPRNGTVSSCKVKEGDNLKADQIILEFQLEEKQDHGAMKTKADIS